MSETWDEYATTWDQGGPVVYADAAVESLHRQAKTLNLPLADTRVLDFGCGTGLLAERLASEGAHIVALDPSKGMIDRLQAKVDDGLQNVTPILGVLDEQMLATPTFAQPFDLVVASSVCAFVEDYPATVRRIASCLRNGGVFVQWDWLRDEDDEEPYGLTPESITQAHKQAGLQVLYVGEAFQAAFEGMTMAPLMGIGRRA